MWRVVALSLALVGVGMTQTKPLHPLKTHTRSRLAALHLQSASKSVPQKINLQGYLTDNSGNPVNGNKPMEFSIWTDSTGGSQVWTSGTQTVSVDSGIFIVNLPVPAEVFTPGSRRWLEISVESTPLSPRIEITSSPWSYRTLIADSATNTAKISGLTINDLDTRFVNDNSGEVGTEDLENDIDATAIGFDADKWDHHQWGDLYPNANATEIQGRPVSSQAPNDGQVLKWNSSANQWEPGTAESTVPTLSQVLQQGNSANGYRITNLGYPQNSSDAATKGWCQSRFIDDINPGDGLTGGGSSGSVTLSVDVSDFAGNGLSSSNNNLNVNVGTGLEISGDQVRLDIPLYLSYSSSAYPVIRAINSSGDGLRGETSGYDRSGVSGWANSESCAGVSGHNTSGDYSLSGAGVFADASGHGRALYAHSQYGYAIHAQNSGDYNTVYVQSPYSSYQYGLYVYGKGRFTGGISGAVKTSKNKFKITEFIESPDGDFYVSGQGHLQNGEARINFSDLFNDNIFAEAVSGQIPVKVIVTPVGSWSGLYVEDVSPEGFTIRSAEGNPNVTFNWIAVGRKKGYEHKNYSATDSPKLYPPPSD